MARVPRRLFDLLASLRIGILSMVTLAVVCGVATFYEASHGTAAAQRAFYQTRWFTLLLALLAANILFSMLKRYPWSRHQAGFVMAHVGILMLLAGSVLSLRFGLDGSVALYEGQDTNQVALRQRALEIDVAGRHVSFPADFESLTPRPYRPLRLAVPGTPVSVVADDYAPHVAVRESVVAAAGGPPAVRYTLAGSFGQASGWLLAGGDGARTEMGPLAVELRAASTEPEARAALSAAATGNEARLVVGPRDRLRFALHGRGSPTIGDVAIGQPIPTPWMGITLTVEEVQRGAARRRTVAPAAPPAKEERRLPAVHVRFDSPAGGTVSEWLPWGETLSADLAEGAAGVTFGEGQAPLPFRISLLEFRSDKYPGSRMAATYESRVRLDEPDGTSSEHVISMNHPLHHRGYVFFQASFVEGERMMSILSVSRSPGLPLVYAGTALLTVGVAWMFYVKPWLARRQARRAVAHRAWSRAVEATP